MRGYNNLFRYRFGDAKHPYRIIYRVNQARRTIDIERVRPRRDAYKGLKRS